jgi:hypothetical protein
MGVTSKASSAAGHVNLKPVREAANRSMSAAQADDGQRFAEVTTTAFPAAKGTRP